MLHTTGNGISQPNTHITVHRTEKRKTDLCGVWGPKVWHGLATCAFPRWSRRISWRLIIVSTQGAHHCALLDRYRVKSVDPILAVLIITPIRMHVNMCVYIYMYALGVFNVELEVEAIQVMHCFVFRTIWSLASRLGFVVFWNDCFVIRKYKVDNN